MKLWSKENTNTPQHIEKFTVGRDNEFDILLAEHDVTGTIAHVKMLQKVGLMTEKESELALKGLTDILDEIRNGKFMIEEGVEDIHSQVELLLTRLIGDAGKKFTVDEAGMTR